VDLIFQVIALWLVASIPFSLFLASFLKQNSAFYALNETVRQNGKA
jgi:hypothetical protein